MGTISDTDLNHAQSGGPFRPKVLLICPKFFDYHEHIMEALEALGYEAIWWTDRPSQSTPYKTFLRLFAEPVGDLSAGHFVRRAEELAPDSLDHVLVVKGEALSPRAMTALRHRFPKARFSLYLWDAIDNARNGKRIAPLFDAVSTFDPGDSQRHRWQFRPLFSLLPESRDIAGAPRYDWSFVGTIHSDRADVLSRIEAAIGPERKGFVFGYFSSRLLYWAKYLLSPAVRNAPDGRFSLRPLPASQTEEVVRASLCSIDVEHPRQVGVTTRCFDALFAGRKLITTNRSIAETALYHPTRVCIVDRSLPMVPAEFFTTAAVALEPATRYAYSSESWVRHVLGLDQRIAFERY